METKRTALGIIDVQRGFMPSSESEQYYKDGFGELPITNGQAVVPVINKLITASGIDMVFTTQDWHPEETAHFSTNPDFTTTWPTHCVAQTDGAKMHPGIKLPKRTYAFKKGFEPVANSEDDTSYSGYNGAILTEFGEPLVTLPEMLARKEISRVILGGLALDYCVKATAIDLADKTEVEVIVAYDATRPVDEMSGIDAVTEMRAKGIQVIRTEDIFDTLSKEES